MTDIEQRAHDLALATAMQIQKAKLNAQMANAANNNGEASLDVRETLDLYCNCYNTFCEELAKRS